MDGEAKRHAAKGCLGGRVWWMAGWVGWGGPVSMFGRSVEEEGDDLSGEGVAPKRRTGGREAAERYERR